MKIFVPPHIKLGIPLALYQGAQRRIDNLRCDAPPQGSCSGLASWAAILWVPSMTQAEPGHDHIRVMTTMTFCLDHRNAGLVTPEQLLTDKMKAMIEGQAKKTRPIDFKCDFGFASHITYTSIWSDGYQRFLGGLAAGRQGAPDQLWQAARDLVAK